MDSVRNKKGLPHYLAKYIAKERKVSEYGEDQHAVPGWYKSVGRFWGCYNRNLLNIRKNWKIRSKPAIDSGFNLPGIPVQTCHLRLLFQQVD
ncbi:hypothetical protein [Marispirochaeta sp.]|uniref:hypothetical protein n=1 Tax=Marispirochaeta sp. TaxID=2038653 RepID=UPI0029C888DF|nr:hypothetical protein [Marispirochaeta sp.]